PTHFARERSWPSWRRRRASEIGVGWFAASSLWGPLSAGLAIPDAGSNRRYTKTENGKRDLYAPSTGFFLFRMSATGGPSARASGRDDYSCLQLAVGPLASSRPAFRPPSGCQHLVEQLIDRPLRLQNGAAMIHRPRKIRIRKGNPPEWRAPQNLPWRRLAVRPEEESGLRTQIGVPPAIEDDRGNITARIKPGCRKHSRELLTDAPLVLPERGCQQLGASPHALLTRG